MRLLHWFLIVSWSIIVGLTQTAAVRYFDVPWPKALGLGCLALLIGFLLIRELERQMRQQMKRTKEVRWQLVGVTTLFILSLPAIVLALTRIQGLGPIP